MLSEWIWSIRKRRARVRLAKELPKGSAIVEVGTFKGDHAALLLRHTKPRLLYLVDPYEAPEDSAEWGDEGWEMDALYTTVQRLFENNEAVQLVRHASPGAVRKVPGRVDVVYIDGDHNAPAVQADLKAWWPRIKPGGRMYGDDFIESGSWGDDVTRAVRDFAQKEGVRLRVDFNQWILDKPPGA